MIGGQFKNAKERPVRSRLSTCQVVKIAAVWIEVHCLLAAVWRIRSHPADGGERLHSFAYPHAFTGGIANDPVTLL